MSIELRHYPDCLSLVNTGTHIERYVQDSQEKYQSTGWATLKGAGVGGLVGAGGGCAALKAGLLGLGAISNPITLVGLAALGVGFLGACYWGVSNVNNKILAEHAKVITDTMKISFDFISVARQRIDTDEYRTIRSSLEEKFIRAIQIDSIFVKNWSSRSYELNEEFDCNDKTDFRPHAFGPLDRDRLKLIFLNAISYIEKEKRSAPSTCHAFHSVIDSLEKANGENLLKIHNTENFSEKANAQKLYDDVREDILFSHYRLGACYTELGEVEKAKEQFDKVVHIVNGTQNESLQNIVRVALNELM